MAEIEPFADQPAGGGGRGGAELVRAYPWPVTPEVEDGWNCMARTGAFLKGLCVYWTDGYDWRAAAAELNKFPQFTAQVEDFNLLAFRARGRRG